jgi:hypothetical protein
LSILLILYTRYHYTRSTFGFFCLVCFSSSTSHPSPTALVVVSYLAPTSFPPLAACACCGGFFPHLCTPPCVYKPCFCPRPFWVYIASGLTGIKSTVALCQTCHGVSILKWCRCDPPALSCDCKSAAPLRANAAPQQILVRPVSPPAPLSPTSPSYSPYSPRSEPEPETQ